MKDIYYVIMALIGFCGFVYLLLKEPFTIAYQMHKEDGTIDKWKNVMDKNIKALDTKFWRICVVVLLIILYLLALNDRYWIEDGRLIYDKWKQKALMFYPDDRYVWKDWDEKPRD
jgi:hypothetical protein